MAGTVVTLVEDIFFLAKIQETAKAVGIAVVAGDPRRVAETVGAANPQAILLDLNNARFPAVDTIRALKAGLATRPIRIIGFVSHVQQELISEARAAGCDTVMARSAFSQQLPNLLRGLIGETGTIRS